MLHRIIRIMFARTDSPGSPLLIDQESAKKLGQIPKLLHAFTRTYGPKLGESTMWGGDIHIAILDVDAFDDLTSTMIADLTTTAEQLIANSCRQPPLPLNQAVTHAHCIDLLRALAQTFAKSRLTASLEVSGKSIELPHVPLTAFTEPGRVVENIRHIRSSVIGVCTPRPEANIVLLGDITLLHLPVAHFPYKIDELYELVLKQSAAFVGQVEIIGKNIYRAMPEGNLEVQLVL